MTVTVRPFRRSDRDQATMLVNAHAQAVVPGVSVSVNAVLSHLEREPDEYLVGPWVRERVTLVAEQRGRISAVAHLVRYGAEAGVGPAMRDTADVRWLLHWPDHPTWPDASAAASGSGCWVKPRTGCGWRGWPVCSTTPFPTGRATWRSSSRPGSAG